MTVTEAARQFADVVNRAYYRSESTLLYKSGEPVARFVPVGSVGVVGREFADRWGQMAHLGAEEAADFGDVIEAARSHVTMPDSKWD